MHRPEDPFDRSSIPDYSSTERWLLTRNHTSSVTWKTNEPDPRSVEILETDYSDSGHQEYWVVKIGDDPKKRCVIVGESDFNGNILGTSVYIRAMIPEEGVGDYIFETKEGKEYRFVTQFEMERFAYDYSIDALVTDGLGEIVFNEDGERGLKFNDKGRTMLQVQDELIQILRLLHYKR